jgi:hypothetical protein
LGDRKLGFGRGKNKAAQFFAGFGAGRKLLELQVQAAFRRINAIA